MLSYFELDCCRLLKGFQPLRFMKKMTLTETVSLRSCVFLYFDLLFFAVTAVMFTFLLVLFLSCCDVDYWPIGWSVLFNYGSRQRAPDIYLS